MPTPTETIVSALDDVFRLIPGVRSVTVVTKDEDSASAREIITPVLGKKSKTDATADPLGGGEAHAERCRWRLLASDLSALPDGLQKRDVIADGEARWLVDAVGTECLETRYVCECTRSREHG